MRKSKQQPPPPQRPTAASLQHKLDQGLALQRQGRLAEAENIFEEIRQRQPNHFDALHLLAVIAIQTGRLQRGVELLTKAIEASPKAVVAYSNLGYALTSLKRYEEAIAVLDKAIGLDPRYAGAYNNLGNALQGMGRIETALESYDKVIALKPDQAEAYNNRGNALQLLRRFGEALASYDRAIALQPGYAEAHNNRGSALLDLKRPEDALASHAKAIALRPDYENAHGKHGNALFALGRFDEALASYDRALALRPDNPQTLNNRGVSLQRLKRFDEALASFDRALALRPGYVDALNNRGNTLHELGRHDDALAAYERALAIEPDHAEVLNDRGVSLQKLKRFDEALASYDRALAARPDYAEALNNRGYVLQELKRYQEALASYDRALPLRPDFAEALYNRGITLNELQRFDEALASYDRALALRPDYVEALCNRGNILAGLARWTDALADYERAYRLDPEHRHLAGLRLHAKRYLCDWTNADAEAAQLLSALRAHKSASVPFDILAIPSSPADQLQCARRYIADKSYASSHWNGRAYQHDRIRVAYVSGDFHEHPTGYLTAGLFERHDAARFETFGISFGLEQNSDLRRRLKNSFEHFIDARTQSDQDIAELIRGHEIDIAIDLMGHTRNSRPGIFARRPAPIQVSYLGFLGTMGADFMDYVIADKIALPFDQQQHYVERIVHLPDCFLVNDDRLAIAPHIPSRQDVGLPAEGFVFCSFNNSYKLARPTFELWMRLLHAVRGSVLWLFQANAQMAANLRREAQKSGVDPDRLVFAPRLPLTEHLARQRLAGLFLDTAPYNAGATGAAALWSGVPMLTMLGETFVGRMAASMLHAVGLPELVTRSLPEYEAMALTIAGDPALCALLKDKLARNRDGYPLFDTERFTRHIEVAYAGMIERHKGDKPPESFAVAPVSGPTTKVQRSRSDPAGRPS